MLHPETHQRPTGERESKRHDSDEQVFPEPRECEHFAMGGFAESAVGENPAGVQPNRQPERGGLEPCVGQDATNHKERQETGREQHRVAELAEGMRDRIESGEPAHRVVRRGLFGRFQKMDDREKRRGQQERTQPREAAQQDSENETAEQEFFEHRHEAGRDEHGWHLVPEKCVSQRIKVKGNNNCAAAEEGNGGNCKADAKVSGRARIFSQTKIAPTAHPQCAQERPKQDQGGYEESTMEIAFEIEPGQAGQHPSCDKTLA